MKKHLLKTMLVATGLLTSAVSAWADGVITTLPVSEDFENGTGIFSGGAINSANSKIGSVLNVYNTTATATFDTDSETDGNQPYTLKSNEKVTIKYTAYQGWAPSASNSEFYIENSEGKKILSYTYNNNKCMIADVAIGGSTASGFSSFACQGYYNGKKSANGYTSQPYVQGNENNPQITISITGEGLVTINIALSKKSIDKTYTGKLDANTIKDLAKISITSTVPQLQEDRGYGIDNFSISSEVSQDVSASYTIKKVCGDNTLEEISATGIVGQSPTISSENIFVNDKKYIYVSNDAETVGNIAEGSVYTINYREAETWDYTVNASVNGETKELVSGFDFEGESVAYNYPQYFNVDGVLYEASRGKSGYYLENATLDADNKIITVNYSATDKKNVVYYGEAEEIEGLTPTDGSLANVRCSKGKGGYNPNEEAVALTTLPAGVYSVTATVWGTRDINLLINYGTDNLTFTTTGSIATSHHEITLNQPTNITIPKCGTANSMFDYIFIQKISEIASISSAEYATYVTKSAVKVPENVKVLTVKANTTGIETAELTAGTVIPAGTAVVLNAEAGDYTLELADEAGTKPADNDLNPATADITADGTQYCLTQNDEGKVGFAKVQVGVNIPAGKAYLVVNNAAAANFFALDGSTTAIKNVETAQTADNAYYTLQGVKVERPAKGIYIKNGKKVVIK